MPRPLIVAVLIALSAALAWRFPLFHIVPLEQAAAEKRDDDFDAARFAADFWSERLTPSLASAADAGAVIAALGADAEGARERFGRQVGLSRSTFFLVRGEGEIVAVEKSRVGVALAGSKILSRSVAADPAQPDLWIVTGAIFGNAVRDSTGLIKSQAFADSQDFNALSSALNAIVERRVLPPLRAIAAPGGNLRFIVAAEVLGGHVRQPLRWIPLDATLD